MAFLILLKKSMGLIFFNRYLTVLNPGSINIKQLNECGILLFVSSVYKFGEFSFTGFLKFEY